jgi:hypothetical protein
MKETIMPSRKWSDKDRKHTDLPPGAEWVREPQRKWSSREKTASDYAEDRELKADLGIGEPRE